MKRYLTAFGMTQSMFCAIPSPFRRWDEKARSCMLLFLPVIGLEIGVLWVALEWIFRSLQVPALVLGLVLSVFPYLVTGFIHLDGFMDVTDAICSWQDLERRREILKDSHVGSFAVVWCVIVETESDAETEVSAEEETGTEANAETETVSEAEEENVIEEVTASESVETIVEEKNNSDKGNEETELSQE